MKTLQIPQITQKILGMTPTGKVALTGYIALLLSLPAIKIYTMSGHKYSLNYPNYPGLSEYYNRPNEKTNPNSEPSDDHSNQDNEQQRVSMAPNLGIRYNGMLPKTTPISPKPAPSPNEPNVPASDVQISPKPIEEKPDIHNEQESVKPIESENTPISNEENDNKEKPDDTITDNVQINL